MSKLRDLERKLLTHLEAIGAVVDDLKTTGLCEFDQCKALTYLLERLVDLSRRCDVPVTESEFEVAARSLFETSHRDHGASRIAANFILSWCNAPGFGGFDFTSMWGLDE